MPTNREQIETRVKEFVSAWLDGVPEDWPDDFDIKTFAFVFEVEFPSEDEGEEPQVDVGWTCSDHRNWVQSGLFRRALIESEAHLMRSADD